MSYVDIKTLVKCNEIIDINCPRGEEENMPSTFLGGWLNVATFFDG